MVAAAVMVLTAILPVNKLMLLALRIKLFTEIVPVPLILPKSTMNEVVGLMLMYLQYQ